MTLSRFGTWAWLSGAALGLAMLIAAPALAQTPPARSAEWTTRCDDSLIDQRQKMCVMVQRLTMNNQPNVHFLVILVKSGQVLRVVAPLGVLLAPGVAVKIDGQDFGGMPFARCLKNGCVAEMDLDDRLLRKLKAGKGANFVIYGQPNQPVNVPVSLNGFTKGYEALP
ncbi:MAG: invasion associated locus B family protein [Alphaproteobacteria bacterium]|nr:invasion associated locus B family protein [Alphaproteobacteria bacterium]